MFYTFSHPLLLPGPLPISRWCYGSLYLTESALDAVADGLGLPEIPYFPGNRIRDTALRDGFLALHRSLQDGTDALCEEERLLASFGGLFSRHGSGHKAARPMQRDAALLRRRSEEHTSELQSLMRISYAVFCLKKKKKLSKKVIILSDIN